MAPTLFSGKDPEIGDLIEIDRGLYNHWAIYVGNDEVVHLIPPDDSSSVLGGLLSLFNDDRAPVRCQKIWDVVGKYDYKVNNLLDHKLPPRPAHFIVKEARKKVGQSVAYSAVTHNCEHFVTELRYGKAESRQVENAAVVAGVGVGVAAFAITGGILLGALLKDDDKEKERRRRSNRY